MSGPHGTTINREQANDLLQSLNQPQGAEAFMGVLLNQLNVAPEQAQLLRMFLDMPSDDTDDGLDIPESVRARDYRAEDSHAATGYQESTSGVTASATIEQFELDSLQEVNDTVAAALGACRYCWGGDDNCEACDGRGQPGAFLPERALFQDLVIPAVRRMQISRKPDSTDPRGGKR